MKKFIWGGMLIGTTAGGFLPTLWGGSPLSMTAVILTAVGGLLGIWLAVKLGNHLGL